MRKNLSKSFFYLKIKQAGFSLIELLTVVSIIGILAIIGIKSYQAQTNKARTTEAKHSLSFIYTSQINFYNTWDTYHENLLVVGAIPDGLFNYDVGFKDVSNLSTTDGNLGSYPSAAQQSLIVAQCVDFHQICNGDCISNAPKVSGQAYTYFSYDGPVPSFSCEVIGSNYVKDYSGLDASSYKADSSGFKALARGKLKDEDVWSINNTRVIEHVQDGTR